MDFNPSPGGFHKHFRLIIFIFKKYEYQSPYAGVSILRCVDWG
jgi:hypothetical protein